VAPRSGAALPLVRALDGPGREREGPRLPGLRYGVDRLSQLPNATIYLDAGSSDWEPARRTAKQLRYIGIAKVRGFMLNVTHHDWTRANIRHGVRISRMVGGRPFIGNTSYNGHRPPPGGRLHVGQPAGLLGGLLQRRAAPGRNVVAGACPDVRPEPDLVARSASRNGAWALPPIAQFARRPESDRPVTHSSRRVGE